MTKLLRALAADVWKEFGWRIIVLFILMVITGVMEGLAIALLVPLLGLVGIGSGGQAPLLSLFEDVFLAMSLQLNIPTVLLLILGVSALQGTAFVGQSWLTSNLQDSYMARWRERLFKAYMHAAWPFFVQSRQSDLTNAVISETDRLGSAFHFMTQLGATALIAIIYFALSMTVSWQVTVLILLVGGLLFVLAHAMVMRTYGIGAAITKHRNSLYQACQEFLSGAKVIKASSSEGLAIRAFTDVSKALQREHSRGTFYPNLLKGFFDISSMAVLCGVLVVGTQVFHVSSAGLLMLIAVFVRLVPRVFGLQQSVQLLSLYLPSIDFVSSSEASARAYREDLSRASISGFPPSKGVGVSISGLSFSYEKRVILDSIDLQVLRGKTIGIVGASGSGKSTLVDCILRLNEPTAGTVMVEGVPIGSIPLGTWRRCIGYVSQETFLFHDSVRNNLLWGSEGVEESDMVEAALKANAHDFIVALPQGYDTILGDRGVRLSGGQKQRIGLARALVNRPPLLILDEATSALDLESEQSVLDAIRSLHGQTTIIIIAHRLSTVRSSDRIYVLERGRMVEEGTWDELIARKSRFCALWELQQAGL